MDIKSLLIESQFLTGEAISIGTNMSRGHKIRGIFTAPADSYDNSTSYYVVLLYDPLTHTSYNITGSTLTLESFHSFILISLSAQLT